VSRAGIHDVVDGALADPPGARRGGRRGDSSVGQSDARLVPGQDERVAHGDRPRPLGSLAAHGHVATEFHDHATGLRDVIGHEVHDERLGARAEIETTRWVEHHRVLIEVEMDRRRSHRRHRHVLENGIAVAEFIEVAVIAQGEESRKHRRVDQVAGDLGRA